MRYPNDILRLWRRKTTCRWLAALALLALAAMLGAVDVSLPDTTANTYETVRIPLTCGDVTGQGVYSVYASISFDADVVRGVGVDTTGTLSADWGSLACNTDEPGRFTLSLYDTAPLEGGGELIGLLLRVESTQDAATALTFERMQFNEGDPLAMTTDGWLEITNRRPYFNPLTVEAVSEGETLTFTAEADDPFELPLTMGVQNAPTGASFTDNGDGTAQFEWSTGYTSAGEYPVEVVAANSQGFADTLSLDLLVRETLDVAFPDTTAMPGETWNMPVYTTATDGLDIYSAYFAVEVDTTVAHITGVSVTGCLAETWGDPTFNITGPGRVVVSLWGVDALAGGGALCHIGMEAVGEIGESAPVAFEYFQFNEGNPDASVADGLLYIGLPNPVFTPVASQSIDEYETVSFNVEATDPLHHDLTLVADSMPAGASFTDNGDGTGEFSWTTDHTSAGDYTVQLTAQNTEAWTDTIHVDIHVEHVPQAPVVVNPQADIMFDMNGAYTTVSMDVVFEDVDSTPTYSVSGATHFQTVLNTDNTWTLTPDADWYGVETLYFTATDEASLSATDIVQVRVIGLLDVVEDFDHAGAEPAGWTTLHSGNNPNPWAIYQQSGDDYCYRVNNPLPYTPNDKLRSPSYDFSGFHDVHVGFWHDFTTLNEFYITFQYSINNGASWNTIASYTNSTSGSVNYDVSAHVDGQSNVRFQWAFVATAPGEVATWELDDLVISGLVSDTTPPPTITGLAEIEHDANSVTLGWTPVSDPHFSAYEVYVSTDATVTTSDMLWSVDDDPLLQDETTAGTTVSGLAFNEHYWFAVRGVDAFGNMGELSAAVDVVLAFPPVWSAPWPQDPQWTASRTIEVGGTITDDATVDASTVQIRVDANGDGAYGPGEDWTAVSGYGDATSLDIRTMATWNLDADSLRFELRAQDTMASGWAYSGFEGLEGPADDWFVRIDTAPPTDVTDLSVVFVSASGVDLSWTPVTEPHFGRYEIYYATHENITLSDSVWSVDEDAMMGEIGTGYASVYALEPDSTYWFAIRAVDEPGNASALSAPIPGVAHSDPPTCDTPWPDNQPTPAWSNSYTVEVGCSFHDWFGVDSTSVQVRHDANGDGVYGAGEDWTNVYAGEVAVRQRLSQRDGASDLVVRTPVVYAVEGEGLAFEFRAWDIHGYGPVYSGEWSSQGEYDDWVVRIDATPPAEIGIAVPGAVTSNSAELVWVASSDAHFVGYEVYYDTQPNVTTDDAVWTWVDDPNLANPGEYVASTIVTGLQPGQDYWFAVRAVDAAGNACALTPDVAITTDSPWPPMTPQNLRIECVGNDAVLTWDAVTQNTNGNAITVGGYYVYVSDSAECPAIIDNHTATVTDTTYTHSGVLDASRLYYRVTAVEGATRDESPPLERLQPFVEKRR